MTDQKQEHVEGYGTGCLHHTHLNLEAKKIGATLSCESSGKWCVWQVEAPEGKVWAATGDTSTLKVEWLKGDAKYRDQAIRDAINRMRLGLADADTEYETD